jgi:hypothetical protein
MHSKLFDDKAKGANEGTVALIHKIEDNVEEPNIVPTTYCMKQGVKNMVIEDPNPPLTIFHKVYNFHNGMKCNIYTDQKGKVLFKSHRGIHYIKSLYKMDPVGILVEVMQARTSGEMGAAYQVLVDRLKGKGFEPKLHIFDNEKLREFKEAIKDNDMKYQLVPPYDHRQNITEKEIQVSKGHFISGICEAENTFPMQLWCRIFRQTEH